MIRLLCLHISPHSLPRSSLSTRVKKILTLYKPVCKICWGRGGYLVTRCTIKSFTQTKVQVRFARKISLIENISPPFHPPLGQRNVPFPWSRKSFSPLWPAPPASRAPLSSYFPFQQNKKDNIIIDTWKGDHIWCLAVWGRKISILEVKQGILKEKR